MGTVGTPGPQERQYYVRMFCLRLGLTQRATTLPPQRQYCSALFEMKSRYSPCLAPVQLPGELSIVFTYIVFIPGENICESQWHFQNPYRERQSSKKANPLFGVEYGGPGEDRNAGLKGSLG